MRIRIPDNKKGEIKWILLLKFVWISFCPLLSFLMWHCCAPLNSIGPCFCMKKLNFRKTGNDWFFCWPFDKVNFLAFDRFLFINPVKTICSTCHKKVIFRNSSWSIGDRGWRIRSWNASSNWHWRFTLSCPSLSCRFNFTRIFLFCTFLKH